MLYHTIICYDPRCPVEMTMIPGDVHEMILGLCNIHFLGHVGCWKSYQDFLTTGPSHGRYFFVQWKSLEHVTCGYSVPSQ